MKLTSTTAILILTYVMPSSSLASSDPKPQPQPPADQDKATNKEELLQLPALPESDPDANIPTLRVGQSLTLESVGPVIINSDGTTRTISNWDTLTEREQEVTWRRIKKRNAERREILEAKQKEMLEQEQEKKD
jgi:hypothetical protein